MAGRGQGATDYIAADLRDTRTILAGAEQTLDFSQPVAVLLIAIMHFVPDGDDPYGTVSRLMDAVPSGSYLTICHAASDINARAVAEGMGLYNERSSTPITMRTRAQVARFSTAWTWLSPAWCRWMSGGRRGHAFRLRRDRPQALNEA